MKISFDEAKKFLKEINEKDKIAIFTHTDLDGFACGVLLYDFFKKKNCSEIEVFFIDYGKNKLSDFNIKEKTKIFICDLAPEIVFEDLKKIPKDVKIFYTDHHQSKEEIFLKNVLELRTTDEGYIPSSRTIFELVGGKEWLAVFGVLADFGEKYEENKNFIENFLRKEGKSLEHLKNDLMYALSRAIIYFQNKRKQFFDILKNVNSIEEIEKFRKYSDEVKKEFDRFVEEFKDKKEERKEIIFFYFEPNYDIKSLLINYLSSKEPEKCYVFLTPNGDLINISLRNQSKKFNLYSLLKETVKNLGCSSGGGHLSAAGGQIKREDLEKFKKKLFSINLNKFLMKNG